jgi:hypothetical protein
MATPLHVTVGPFRAANPVAPREARIQAAMLIPGRFAGRQALERLAEHDDFALAQLRKRLGLRVSDEEVAAAVDKVVSNPARQRVAANRLGSADASARGSEVDAFVHAVLGAPTLADKERACARAPDVCANVFEGYANASDLFGGLLARRLKVRGERAAARKESGPKHAGPFPRLDRRRPGDALRAMVKRRFHELIRERGFRQATSGHTALIEVVPPGREGASSSTEKAWLGKNKYPSLLSTHAWHLSEALLSAPVAKLNASGDGRLYLRPDLRVRQGAGTALVTERRQGPRGRWVAS